MVRQGFFCKVVTFKLRQECWDEASNEGSLKSLPEKVIVSAKALRPGMFRIGPIASGNWLEL